MKKLFASLLAATMVAGMAVSAFAYTDKDASYTALDNQADYTIANKTYKLDKAAGLVALSAPTDYVVDNDTKLYFPIIFVNEDNQEKFLTRASETDDLSVKLKDVRNGKYLKDPKIVKVDFDGNDEAKEVGTLTVSAASSADGVATISNILKAGGNLEVALNNAVEDDETKTAAKIAKTINDTADSMYTATSAAAVVTLTAKEVGTKTAPVFTAGTASSSAASYSQTTNGKANAKTAAEIYAIEVKVADYYQTEAGELEFNLELRNKGRVETATKDFDSFVSYFTIGTDATEEGTNRKGTQKIELANTTGPVKFDKAVDNILLLGGKAFPVEFEVKAAEQGEIYLDVDKKISKDIVVANPDAELEFLTFNGNPTFDFTGTLKYFVADDAKEWFMYEIVDGKPVATDAKYNKEDACFELRTRTLGKYVVSDKALVLGAEEKPAEKPAEDKPATTDKVVGTGALA